MKTAHLALAVSGLLAFLASPARAQHFTFTGNTGNYMTVFVRATIAPEADGAPLANGDEIGAFTPGGMCVGAIVWQGADNALTVWGDNSQTGPVDGMRAGDTLRYRIWRASSSTEMPAVVTYASGGPAYASPGFAVLASLGGRIPPAFGIEPSAQSLFAGTTATFRAVASGSAPIAYQWLKDGVAIPGATDTLLQIPSLAAANAGDYRCVASNAVGKDSTAPARLTVLNPTVTVTAPNGGQRYLVGETVPVTWTSTGPIDSVRIEYTTNGGGAWNLITSTTPNDGSHMWTLPMSSAPSVRVRVTGLGGGPGDTSDAPFEIAAPTGIRRALPGARAPRAEAFDCLGRSLGRGPASAAFFSALGR